MEISSVRSWSAYSPGQSTQSTRSGSGIDRQQQRDEEALQALKNRDAEVRHHELAHLAAAGNLAQGGASFTYERGPDGQLYAVGGEVSIDVSPAATPEASIAKAQQIRAAAQAPADPSAQDRSVAAQAARLEYEARAELARTKQASVGEDGNGHASDIASQTANRLYITTQAQSHEPMSRLIASA